MGNFFTSQNLQRGNIGDALNVATAGQNYNTSNINNLMNTGLVGRTRDQGQLDFDYAEFMREQTDPMQKALFSSQVMGSYPTNLFTRKGTEETSQTPSAFSQIAGIGLARSRYCYR